MSFNLSSYLAGLRQHIDQALRDLLPQPAGEDYLNLRRAMLDAVLDGGKRLRPCIAIAACQTVGGDIRDALNAACALEMIHAYSLVHDDLPAMDNDDVRRGKPTCHKKYGDAAAILVGDALLTLAFEVIAQDGIKRPERAAHYLQASRELANAAGVVGMVGGQAMDMALKGTQPTFDQLEICHAQKTAALFAGAAAIGAWVGGATIEQVDRLRKYGFELGLAFQHADDLRDAEFPEHRSRSLEQCVNHVGNAAKIANEYGSRGTPLLAMAELVEQRAREATPHEISTAN